MRAIVSLAILLLVSGVARGQSNKDPDLTLKWMEGEMSKDASIWTTKITVTGTSLHYSRRYSGRNDGMPGTKPTDVDGVVKDPAKLAAAIAAFDKAPVAPPPKNPDSSGAYSSGCMARGKAERCATHRGTEPETEELKALAAIEAVLLEGVKLPP